MGGRARIVPCGHAGQTLSGTTSAHEAARRRFSECAERAATSAAMPRGRRSRARRCAASRRRRSARAGRRPSNAPACRRRRRVRVEHARAQHARRHAADRRERAGIGRRDGAHEVVNRRGATFASRCARPRACGRRNTIPARRRCGCRGAVPATSAGSAASRQISAATVTLSNTSRAVSSGRIGTACCATMSPASGLSAM